MSTKYSQFHTKYSQFLLNTVWIILYSVLKLLNRILIAYIILCITKFYFDLRQIFHLKCCLHRMLMFSVTPSKSSSYLLSIFRLHSFTFITVCHYQEDFVRRENKRFYSILFYSIIIRLRRCAVQCKISYIEKFFWYKCCRPYAAPPPPPRC